MHIEYIVCPDYIEDKLESKHSVTVQETRQILLGSPRIRFVEKGHQIDDNLYVAYGQTYGGRYLAVFFVYKRASATAIIISARNMMKRERKSYGKK